MRRADLPLAFLVMGFLTVGIIARELRILLILFRILMPAR